MNRGSDVSTLMEAGCDSPWRYPGRFFGSWIRRTALFATSSGRGSQIGMHRAKEFDRGGRKVVLLVDWLWAGHHPAYFSQFAIAILGNGHDLLIACPRPHEVVDQVTGNNDARRGRLLSGMRVVGYASARALLPRSIRPWWSGFRQVLRIRQVVKEMERKHEVVVADIFFACIYDRDWRFYKLLDLFIHRRWSGLVLHLGCRRALVEKTGERSVMPILRSASQCCGIGILDEGQLDQVASLLPGKRVVVFPDAIDQRDSKDGFAGIAEKLRAFSAGRFIVGCIGHLQRYKGVLGLVRAASQPALSDCVFAFVGEVSWDEFSEEEIDEIQSFWRTDARAFCFPLRVPDGSEINSVIRCCDLVYAVYENFAHSSNIMVKASFCRKPVLVARGFLMAERVERYRLGSVVDYGDYKAIGLAISAHIRAARDPISSETPNWIEFLASHSSDLMGPRFAELLDAN